MRQEIDYGKFRYEGLSLLWKSADIKEFYELSASDMDDLNIASFRDMVADERELDVYDWLNQVPINKEDSLYRQEIMRDFMTYPELFRVLSVYGSQSHQMMTLSKFAFEKEATVYNLIKRMDEVETIRNMVEKVLTTLKSCDIKSKGLLEYRELLQLIVDAPVYEAFTDDVRNIKELESGVKSIKIGLNLDEYLQPVEAILLELSDEEFKYSRFDKKMGYYISYGISEIKMIPRKIFAKETVAPPEALNMLEKTIEPATLQLITFCDQFNMKIMEVLSILYHELPFYQIGMDLAGKLTKNREPVCLPVWEDELVFEDIYHINLGIDHKEEVIKNTITISREQPIVVLTGANRGGKTTITQTMCITMWFAQLGFSCLVPRCRFLT